MCASSGSIASRGSTPAALEDAFAPPPPPLLLLLPPLSALALVPPPAPAARGLPARGVVGCEAERPGDGGGRRPGEDATARGLPPVEPTDDKRLKEKGRE